MARKVPTTQGNSSISFNADEISIGGDVVGRDKHVTNDNRGSFASLQQQFAEIKRLIERRPVDPNIEKAEIREVVEKIEIEVQRGPQANNAKVERWLRFLASMAEDIFDVTVAALTHPAAGAAKAIQLIARKAQEEK